MQYKVGAERNVRDIAKALGVAHVLEGSVQRAGGRVRVNAQLIDARTDSHLWADRYDRDVADVFAIESEVAGKIVAQLQAKISASENAAIQSLLRLRPGAGETHLALARHFYFGYLDYDRARGELTAALQALPNNAEAFVLAAYIDRRQGRWEESTRNFEHAADLDPRST